MLFCEFPPRFFRAALVVSLLPSTLLAGKALAGQAAPLTSSGISPALRQSLSQKISQAEEKKAASSTASATIADEAKSATSEAPPPDEKPTDEKPVETITADPNLGRDGKPLSPELIALREKIRLVLGTYEPKHLNARDHTSWEVMHGLIAFGPKTQIFRDGPGGPTVNAMGWLCWGGRCRGDTMIVLQDGHLHSRYGVGLQGHDGQYLSMLAQWRVKPSSPMQIGGKDWTVADFIEEEKVSCVSGTELTFKLIALSHYLPSDAKWRSRNGEEWTIPKLIKAEIEAPIRGAACGGTHRLFGISNAYKVRLKREEPLDGEYARAHKYISDYHRYTLGSLQNRDGSFSTDWFNGPADRSYDPDRKVQTTGHILEWLSWSLPDEGLRDPRVMKAANCLADLLAAEPNRTWKIGPLGHALHSLNIYQERMFVPTSTPTAPPVAATPLAIATKPQPSIHAPPEPDCENCVELFPAEKLKAAIETSKTSTPAPATAKPGDDDCVPEKKIAVDATTDTAPRTADAVQRPAPVGSRALRR